MLKKLLFVLPFMVLTILLGSFISQDTEKEDQLITLTTSKGNIYVLVNKETPKHAEVFLKYIKQGKLSGKSFYKAVSNLFVQGGSKTPEGESLKREANLPQTRGAICSKVVIDPVTRQKKSYVSQFYIVRTEEGLPYFEKTYVVFAKVIKGMDVIDAIAAEKKDVEFNLESEVGITAKVEWTKKKKITKLTGYKYE